MIAGILELYLSGPCTSKFSMYGAVGYLWEILLKLKGALILIKTPLKLNQVLKK